MIESIPMRSAALRVAILLFVTVALDFAAGFFLTNPRIWCGVVIPSLMLFAPFVVWRWKKN